MSKTKTTEQFIEDAKKVHGDKYDYSLVDYKGNRIKVKIICPKHGVFEQAPNCHIIQKQGCPFCAGKIKKTTEQFIKEAKEVHGDKYDYSLVDYENINSKVKIICPIHGVFEQKPHTHLNGSGCPKCVKVTTEKFIQKAKKIHGDKYDYSLVDYKDAKTKVKIICPIHGVFEQKPNGHLNGCGCPNCGINKTKMTLEEFIQKAKEVHGDKYDYSLTDYKDTRTKVKIICPVHGVFEQTPNSHLSGRGCLKCFKKSMKTTEQFIKEAKEVHDDKYDYSLVDYKNGDTKVKIKCNACGNIFEQIPNSHLNGCGCPNCKRKKIGEAFRKTTEQFIKEAKEVHGDKYDYSLVDYKNGDTKVKIICPIHGEFEQTPYCHLKSSGCPKCGREAMVLKQSFSKEIFIKKANKIHNNFYNYDKFVYNGIYSKGIIICPIHGEFIQSATKHLRHHGCPQCAIETVKNKLKKSTEQFIKEAKEVHGDKYDYSLVDYKNSDTKVKIICPIHGVFEQAPSIHLKNGGCPFCLESIGAKKTLNYLIERNIVFEREKRFFDCKNIRPLPFDFYLPNCNTCIEYDGRQHFEIVERFGGEKELKRRQENDKIKTDYCLKNHIRLIRIRYWETVEAILDLYNLK